MNPQLPLLVKEYGQRLQAAGVPKAHQEALTILKQILGTEAPLDAQHKEIIDGAIFLRERRMPLERIFGVVDFCGLSLQVENDVFKPYPETEDLVHYAVEAFPEDKRNIRILDLGTGSGCILLALLRAMPQASGIGTDVSDKALALAGENARANGLAARAEFRKGDWSEGIDEKFDLIISNPPRARTDDIPRLLPEMRDYDPLISLDGGRDGLDFVRRLAKDFGRLSTENGVCLCQLGDIYADEVVRIFRYEGFRDVTLNNNFVGVPCCATVRKGLGQQKGIPLFPWMAGFINPSF